MACTQSLADAVRLATSILTITIASAFPAQAETFNYACKDQGQSFPLKVDDARNILEWRSMTYRIKETENCAKFGWRAEKAGVSFDFCTATQGYADFQLNGRTVQCSLKRR